MVPFQSSPIIILPGPCLSIDGGEIYGSNLTPPHTTLVEMQSFDWNQSLLPSGIVKYSRVENENVWCRLQFNLLILRSIPSSMMPSLQNRTHYGIEQRSCVNSANSSACQSSSPVIQLVFDDWMTLSVTSTVVLRMSTEGNFASYSAAMQKTAIIREMNGWWAGLGGFMFLAFWVWVVERWWLGAMI